MSNSTYCDIHSMKKIELKDPHRVKHFEFFNAMTNPHFSITAAVDITGMDNPDSPGSFNTRMVYLISRAANEISYFRQRIRGNEIIEHEKVNPSFTVPTEQSEMFSFCSVEYFPDYPEFRSAAELKVQKMKTDPSLEDEPGRDDYLFLSAIPWLRFTHIQHAMNYDPCDSVPRISWGQYYKEDDKLMIPLAVQVHHAVMDARHMALLFEKIKVLAANPETLRA